MRYLIRYRVVTEVHVTITIEGKGFAIIIMPDSTKALPRVVVIEQKSKH